MIRNWPDSRAATFAHDRPSSSPGWITRMAGPLPSSKARTWVPSADTAVIIFCLPFPDGFLTGIVTWRTPAGRGSPVSPPPTIDRPGNSLCRGPGVRSGGSRCLSDPRYRPRSNGGPTQVADVGRWLNFAHAQPSVTHVWDLQGDPP